MCVCLVVGCIHGHNNNNNEEVLPEKSDKIGAVVVGMEISKLVGNCPGSYLDCQNIKDTVSLYTDNVVVLANEDATKDAVAKALQAAVDKYEYVYFYYSGHGGSQKFNTTGPEEIDGQDEYLCFYDDYMLDNEVWSIISKAKGPVFLMFDCCHSETMFRTPQFSFKNSLKRMQSSRNTDKKFAMLCWSGCPDNAYSYGSSARKSWTASISRSLPPIRICGRRYLLMVGCSSLRSRGRPSLATGM